jgi:diguanylate cyclase (GGDEF)-like protein
MLSLTYIQNSEQPTNEAIKMTTEERLLDIFAAPRWQDHFVTLSRALGFSLGIYSEQSPALRLLAGSTPFCAPLMGARGFHVECETSCRSRAMDVLRTHKARWFYCSARVMSFAVPVFYLNDRAVLVGRGSFSSYTDFRAYLNLLQTVAAGASFPVSSPLRFTTENDAQNAYHLVDRSVNQLLRNSEETLSLKKKMLNLKEIVSSWWRDVATDPDVVRENLVRNLMTIVDISSASILTVDLSKKRYVTTHFAGIRPESGGGPSLPLDHATIQSLQTGQSFVLQAELAVLHEEKERSEVLAHYYFPIWVNGMLENILLFSDGLLMESDLNTIGSLCRQVGLMIENGRLQHDLSEKFSRIVAVNELSKEISTINSYEGLLRSILDQSAKLLMAEQGSLMVIDQKTDALLVEARVGTADLPAKKIRILKGEGIAGRVAQNGEAILVQNVERDPRILQKNRENYKTPSFVSVPLKIGDRIIGVLNLADKTTGEVFDRDDLHLIQSFATHAAVVLERNTLFTQTEQLKKLSITDPLTGLLNRRYFQERLEEEVARSQRHNRPVSLLMVDLDGFKRFNDTFGHPAGDRALRLTGDTLLRMVRHMDIVARLGGDEFVVILPETGPERALQIAERIRQEIAEIKPPDAEPRPGKAERLSVSIGIASYTVQDESAEAILEHADQALYRAKAAGRNRIEVYT